MKKYFICLLLCVVLIVFFKIWNVHATFSDENVYFSLAKNVYSNHLPYKNFSFVHPPFQLFTISIFFKIFGPSLLSGKLVAIIFSSLSVLFLFLIGRKIFREDKKALVSSLFFIIFPAFIIFSDQELGVWESIFFFLSGLYCLLDRKYVLSSLLFSISVFYRYLSLLFFPLLVYFSEDRKKFIFFSILFNILIFSILFYFFGYEFIYQSVSYQLFNKLFMQQKLAKDYWRYISLGSFTLSILIASFLVSYENWNKNFLIISFYSISYELLLFLTMKTLAYHYFLYTLPFVALCFSYSFFSAKSLFIRIFLLTTLILSLISASRSIDFYLNKERSKFIEEIANYIASTAHNEKIWGEPTIVSYIAFSRNIQQVSNYNDPFIDYWRYLDEEKVIEVLERERPKFVIDMNSYLMKSSKFSEFIDKYYVLDKTFGEREAKILYFVYKRLYDSVKTTEVIKL